MTTPQDPFSTPDPGRTPPPSQPAQGYGQPAGFGQSGGHGEPYGTAPQQGHRNGLGTAALVLGIIGLLTSWIFGFGGLLGIGAIVLGIIGVRRVSRREASNKGSAIAGIVLGVLSLLVAALVVAGTVALFGSDAGQRLIECTQDAAQDQAALQECQREFEQSQQG